jgi:hypothetical protein
VTALDVEAGDDDGFAAAALAEVESLRHERGGAGLRGQDDRG